MKKNFIFTIYAIALAVFFILSGAFLVGTPNAPETYWLSSVKQTEEGEIENSGFTLELDVDYTVKGEDGEEETAKHDICKAYAYIGKVYSFNSDGKVDIVLDFKTKSSGETSYNERVRAVISKSYSWVEIYDGKISGNRRVKIHSPQSFELCEVAFLAEDGSLLKVDKLVSQSEGTKSSASFVFDEQGSFNPSSAYAYNLSDKEREELISADDLFNGGETLGSAPLTTALNGLAVLIFGRNPFAIRFFSLLAGYASLILAFLILKRLFDSDTLSLFGSLFILFACSLFSGAVTATTAVSVPFILSAYYLAIGFYAELYRFDYKSATYKNLLFTGLFVGLAVSCGASNIVSLAGVPVIWGISLFKLSKDYKKEYESAKGLDKETVYYAYNGKTATYAYLMPISFVVIPVLVALLTYAINYNAVSKGGGFFAGVISNVVGSFKTERNISALGVLIGYGSETVGSGYKAFNYIPFILFALGFAFTTFFAVAGKTEKFGKIWRGIKNKYILTTIIAVSVYIPLAVGINLSVGGTALFSCAYSIYAVMALSALKKSLGKKVFNAVSITLISICFVTFIGLCFGIFGLEISEGLKNALYAWQL